MPVSDHTRERRLRRRAHQQGRSLRKSRVRTPHLDDLGGYMLLDHESTSSHDGVVVAPRGRRRSWTGSPCTSAATPTPA